MKAVKILAVDGGYKFAGSKTEQYSGRKVVFADAVAELEVLVKHYAEG